MPSLERELAERLERGEEAVLATVIRLDGAPPSRPGAKTLMARDRVIAGTLGCSEFDSAALADAPALLDSGTPETRTYRHDLGSIEVYLEPHAGSPTLVVFAATPVASHLLRWAPDLGYRTVLVETRPERRSGFDGAGAIVVADLDHLAEALKGRPRLSGVHTDHDAPDLEQALEGFLALRPGFLGLMGSRRHTGHHLDALAARGMDPALIAQVRSPVGLDIGSRTPAEIAVSILAGLVADREDRTPRWLDR